MDQIHSPTVPAGPTSSRHATNGSGIASLSLRELADEKKRLEVELDALGSVLESHGVNMTTSLVTFDGYPRDDIDVAQIRTTRARIVRLKNDYKAIMNRIENELHAHHASMASQQSQTPAVGSSSAPLESQRPPAITGAPETPFARVSSVAPGGPASTAGVKEGDAIRRFGNVNWINHEKLTKVAEVVRRNEGRVVLVRVQRREEGTGENTEWQLELIPRRDWGGRGLLGCHIVPV